MSVFRPEHYNICTSSAYGVTSNSVSMNIIRDNFLYFIFSLQDSLMRIWWCEQYRPLTFNHCAVISGRAALDYGVDRRLERIFG